ncbi:hypothetical protein AB833_09720 [Chromatiales bacterium (ex Bugula neritina AB1)]|nr:hypothetical protein AB833_09720 [Chromatiales bacterium (ex Bugula neritina AB1)]
MLLISAFIHAADVDVTDKIAVCQGCHGGSDSAPINADTPILAGQEYYYLYVQLKDYKAGRRANAVMSGMAAPLSKDEMKALAEHYSSMEWPTIRSEIDDDLATKGNSALSAGQCSQCHSTYQGDSRVPRLAGQQLPYLLQTMKDFKNKVRLNSPAKGSLMDSFSDEDLAAMANHLSGL